MRGLTDREEFVLTCAPNTDLNDYVEELSALVSAGRYTCTYDEAENTNWWEPTPIGKEALRLHQIVNHSFL